jgi:hypothetical protein
VRQIWQGFVASGFSLSFRWPRPTTDSDDDLLSDITDLTVANLKNAKTMPPNSFVGTPSPPQRPMRETDGNSAKKEPSTKRTKLAEDSDVSSIHSVEMKNTDAAASENVQLKEIESLKCRDRIPSKNYSKEYIDKFIVAINCFNELFTRPATDNNETVPDKGVSVNYHFTDQADSTKETQEKETQRSTVGFVGNDNNDCNQANIPVSKGSGNLNEKPQNSAAMQTNDQCVVRLNTINVDELSLSRSNCTPSKSETTETGHRRSRRGKPCYIGSEFQTILLFFIFSYRKKSPEAYTICK